MTSEKKADRNGESERVELMNSCLERELCIARKGV